MAKWPVGAHIAILTHTIHTLDIFYCTTVFPPLSPDVSSVGPVFLQPTVLFYEVLPVKLYDSVFSGWEMSVGGEHDSQNNKPAEMGKSVEACAESVHFSAWCFRLCGGASSAFILWLCRFCLLPLYCQENVWILNISLMSELMIKLFITTILYPTDTNSSGTHWCMYWERGLPFKIRP